MRGIKDKMDTSSDDAEVQSAGSWSFTGNSEILMIPKVLCFLAGSITGVIDPLFKDFDCASLAGFENLLE